MSQENVEAVRRAGFRLRESTESATAPRRKPIFDPDVVMNNLTNEGSFHGLDAMRDEFERWCQRL